jgi:hypothetical protein
MPDQERPWVRIVGALILGGATVSAALVPLYCAKQNRLAETVSTVQTTRSEIDVLRQRIAQDDNELAARNNEIMALRRRAAAAPADCPPPSAVLTNSPTAQTAAPSNTAAIPASGKSIRTVQEREVEFGLQSCHLSGTTLTCDFLFTSKGADRLLTLVTDTRSRLLDSAGREVRAGRFVAGARHAACDGCNVDTTLPGDVALAGQATFEGVQPGTKQLQLLELQVRIGDPKRQLARHHYEVSEL